MLKNAPALAMRGVDRAENEPSKVSMKKVVFFYPRSSKKMGVPNRSCTRHQVLYDGTDKSAIGKPVDPSFLDVDRYAPKALLSANRATAVMSGMENKWQPGLKDAVADRPNHSNLCTSEFAQNSVRIQENYQNSSEIL